MADALREGCDSIVTCGGIQSNHARATAVAAAQLGLKPHLVLRWRGPIVSCSYNPEDVMYVAVDKLCSSLVVSGPSL